MRWVDITLGGDVETKSGRRGRVVTKSNGTVYLELDDGRFERHRCMDVEALAATPMTVASTAALERDVHGDPDTVT
jgi:hypothetical protein